MYRLLEEWFPLQGERAHSLNFVVCMYVNRINLPKSIYNSSQTTSPPPNTKFYHKQSI